MANHEQPPALSPRELARQEAERVFAEICINPREQRERLSSLLYPPENQAGAANAAITDHHRLAALVQADERDGTQGILAFCADKSHMGFLDEVELGDFANPATKAMFDTWTGLDFRKPQHSYSGTDWNQERKDFEAGKAMLLRIIYWAHFMDTLIAAEQAQAQTKKKRVARRAA